MEPTTTAAVAACARGMIHLDVLQDLCTSMLDETNDRKVRERASDALAVIDEARGNLAVPMRAARKR